MKYFIGDVTSEDGCDICYCTTEGEDCQANENAIRVNTRHDCLADCVIKGKKYFIGDVTNEDGCDICYCTTEGEDCQANENAIIDGEWSAWTDWSQCSKSCKGGRETRTRQCNEPLPKCGGDPCPGNNTQTRPCNRDVSCCEVTAWSDWSDCSATCDSGVRTRTREYVNPSDKQNCHEILQESTVCKEHDCDAKCEVTKWSLWSSCSESCGTGKKTRTRDIRGRDTGDCPPLTDNQPCYENDCPCDKNEVYSNYTLCEQTCNERFEPVDSTCEEKMRPGCTCEEGYFRDEDGDCVTMDECNKCTMDGIPRDNGETWTPADDECSVCECVAGDVKCTPVCEIPTCKEGEVLSYDVPNKCCPRCVVGKDTCRLYNHTDFLYDAAGRCRSISKVTFTFCQGGCGDSVSTPTLVMGYDKRDVLEQDCRCCTGHVGSYIPVKVKCGYGVQQKMDEAMLPVLNSCTCEPCKESGGMNMKG